MNARDDIADGIPGDTHILGDCALVELGGQPCGTVLEILGEAGAMESPRHTGNDHTVARTADTLTGRFYFNDGSTAIQGAPFACNAKMVIVRTFLAKMRAAIL